MTSQVAVLNLHGAAVASDSVLTLGAGSKQRTISSMEKIFDLGERHRVVVMINDSAQFMGVPWAPILNQWRTTLQSPFSSVSDYWESLQVWLSTSNPYVTPEQEEAFLREALSGTYLQVRQALIERFGDDLERAIDKPSSDTAQAVDEVVDACIGRFLEPVEYEGTATAQDKRRLTKLVDVIQDTFDYIFDDVPRTPNSDRRLVEELPAIVMAHAQADTPQTELAFIGFGENDAYAIIKRVLVEGVFNGLTRWYSEGEQTSVSPLTGTTGRIEGFGQSDAIFAFVRGIDPTYHGHIDHAITTTLAEFEDESLADIDEEDREEIREALIARVDEAMEAWKHTKFVNPMFEAIAAMPPLELARISEALVGIQALRADSASELPTVGGDIDVVVITRQAGVKWIKRQQHAH